MNAPSMPRNIQGPAMSPEELQRFDEASNHPYECRCDLCLEWWSNVSQEDDEWIGDLDSEHPF